MDYEKLFATLVAWMDTPDNTQLCQELYKNLSSEERECIKEAASVAKRYKNKPTSWI